MLVGVDLLVAVTCSGGQLGTEKLMSQKQILIFGRRGKAHLKGVERGKGRKKMGRKDRERNGSKNQKRLEINTTSNYQH